LANLASWREKYPNPRISKGEKFARAEKILKHSSTKITKKEKKLISIFLDFVSFVVSHPFRFFPATLR